MDARVLELQPHLLFGQSIVRFAGETAPSGTSSSHQIADCSTYPAVGNRSAKLILEACGTPGKIRPNSSLVEGAEVRPRISWSQPGCLYEALGSEPMSPIYRDSSRQGDRIQRSRRTSKSRRCPQFALALSKSLCTLLARSRSEARLGRYPKAAYATRPSPVMPSHPWSPKRPLGNDLEGGTVNDLEGVRDVPLEYGSLCLCESVSWQARQRQSGRAEVAPECGSTARVPPVSSRSMPP